MKNTHPGCIALRGVAFAGARPPKKEGIEGKDYKWNAQAGEKVEALHKKGDVKAGKEAYEVCGACHLSGAGRPDGTFPSWPASTAPC